MFHYSGAFKFRLTNLPLCNSYLFQCVLDIITYCNDVDLLLSAKIVLTCFFFLLIKLCAWQDTCATLGNLRDSTLPQVALCFAFSFSFITCLHKKFDLHDFEFFLFLLNFLHLD